MGATEFILSQDGSYFDDTNPSFILVFDKGGINEISNGLGEELNPLEMLLLLSPKMIKRANRSGSFSVVVGKKTSYEVDKIYLEPR